MPQIRGPRLEITALLLAASNLVGCASTALYQWAGYDDHLYASYKDPSKTEALRLRLQTHVQEAQSAGRKVAPGLYAELGTLYLQAGQRTQAMSYYDQERQTWPESQQLMSALIQNIKRLEQQAQGSKP